MSNVQIKLVGVLPWLEAVPPKIRRQVIKAALNALRRRARAEAPRGKTGKLRRNLRTKVAADGFSGRVYGYKTPYLHLVVQGTHRHRIPRDGYAHLSISGNVRSWAMHPGSKSNPFFDRAMTAEKGNIERIMIEASNKALAEAAQGKR